MFSTYMKGVPMCLKSKACSITLSSTEAKWIALLKATKEIIFVLLYNYLTFQESK